VALLHTLGISSASFSPNGEISCSCAVVTEDATQDHGVNCTMYNERIKAGVCLNFFSSWRLAECPNVALDEL
jgi:hypothetical protein